MLFRFTPQLIKPLLAACLLIAGAFLNSPVHAATLTVGFDPICDFANLQVAINAAADGDRIELQEAIHFGPFSVLDKSLTLVGGFDRCGGEQAEITRLDGQDLGRVLLAEAQQQRRTLRLEHLYITGGQATTTTESEGGGIAIYGAVDLQLEQVQVIGNEAHAGGGIYAFPLGLDTPSVFVRNSAIEGNRARLAHDGSRGQGGGIYFWHSGLGPEQLEIVDSSLADNHAESYGGAVSLYSASLKVRRGDSQERMIIERNSADLSGGAVAAWQSDVSLDGVRFPAAPEIGLELRDNWARQNGGAVHLRWSTLEADAVAFTGNTSTQASGGAIAAVEDSKVSIGHNLTHCTEDLGCNTFEKNWAKIYGGALVVNGSTAKILATRGAENVAGAGGAFLDATSGQTIEIWSTALTRHKAQALIYVHFGNVLDVRSSTFYDNEDLSWTTIRPFGIDELPIVSQSIFHNNGGGSLVSGDDVRFACNMIGILDVWPSIREGGFNIEPIFQEGSFRLARPPGQACGFNTPSAPVDIDYETRPGGIAFDFGADELP